MGLLKLGQQEFLLGLHGLGDALDEAGKIDGICCCGGAG